MTKSYRDQDDAELGETLTMAIYKVKPILDANGEPTDELSSELVQTIETDLRVPSASLAGNPYRDAD